MELVQIYLEKLNKLAIINFPAFVYFLYEKVFFLDPDSGGKMNADPDPQPCSE